jgi:AraC-like DNA-binding protein
MPPHLLARHRLLVTSDLEESQRFLSAIWERHQSVPRGSSFAIRWHQADLQQTSLAYVDHPCGVTATCDGPLGDYFRVLLPFSGRMENRINGRRAVLTPSSIVLHAPGQDLKLEIDEFRLLLLSFDGGFARRALQRRFRTVPPLETWAAEFPRGSAAASSLFSLSHWLAGELDRPNSIFRAGRAVASLERALLSVFVELLAGQYPEEETRPGDIANGQLALIEAWIEANLSEAFGVEDLAAVANVSARSVQLAFGRLRGCTPMQFVLGRRLERAKALLQAPTPATTVTRVAMDCGCFHLSRFAAAYRRHFGEKPSETLARAMNAAGLPAPPPEPRTGPPGPPASAD